MGSKLKTMQWKAITSLLLLLATSISSLKVAGYPYLTPRSPTSYLIPANFLPSSYNPVLPYSIPANRAVICSACSCDNDFFCGWNCPKCSEESFCSSCNCIFPFIYNGVQYHGCTPLINGLASVYTNP